MCRYFANQLSIQLILLLLAGCLDPALLDPVHRESEEAFQILASEYEGVLQSPELKGDGIFGFDVCEALDGLLNGDHGLTKVGFFMGANGLITALVADGFFGFDVVYDLTHRQIMVSQYRGAGVETPSLGASLSFYGGFAAGFHHSVDDWNGYFTQVSGEVVARPLAKFVKGSVKLTGFASAEDVNGNGVIDWDDRSLFLTGGVYGFSIGLNAEVDVLPDLLPDLSTVIKQHMPISGQVNEGHWRYSPWGTHVAFETLEFLTSWSWGFEAELVDLKTGERCPADWFEEQPDRVCVIQVGAGHDSPLRASLDMSRAVCKLGVTCLNPMTAAGALASLGIGSFQEFGDELIEACPNLAR